VVVGGGGGGGGAAVVVCGVFGVEVEVFVETGGAGACWVVVAPVVVDVDVVGVET
jgi:hypothetical protein